jgi:hypothetical protein
MNSIMKSRRCNCLRWMVRKNSSIIKTASQIMMHFLQQLSAHEQMYSPDASKTNPNSKRRQARLSPVAAAVAAVFFACNFCGAAVAQQTATFSSLGTWSTAVLSVARSGLVATSLFSTHFCENSAFADAELKKSVQQIEELHIIDTQTKERVIGKFLMIEERRVKCWSIARKINSLSIISDQEQERLHERVQQRNQSGMLHMQH